MVEGNVVGRIQGLTDQSTTTRIETGSIVLEIGHHGGLTDQSTAARIETPKRPTLRASAWAFGVSPTNPLQQGLKPQLGPCGSPVQRWSHRPIHYNKD